MKTLGKPIDMILVTLFSLLTSAAFIYIAQNHPELYRTLTDESTGTELATAILYLIAGLLLCAFAFRNRMTPARVIFLALLGLFFIFIAGEEESWGMWIFGFEAPEAVAEINDQNEINIHNLGLFSGLLQPHRVLNAFIFLFAVLVPVLDGMIHACRNLLQRLHFPVVDVRLAPWFLIAMLYDRMALISQSDPTIQNWRHTEIAEFLYSVGLLVFTLVFLRAQKSYSEKAERA